MKHGRAIIPEPGEQFGSVADPEADCNRFNKRISRRCFVPSAIKALLRNGAVVSERAVLDADGQAWLKIALNEFRDNPCWERPMSLSLIRAALFGVPGFREEKDAATDEATDEG